jgi:translation initiation factor 5
MKGAPRSNDEILSELRRIQIARDLSETDRLKVLLHSLVGTASADAAKVFKSHAPLFKLCTSKSSAEAKNFLLVLEEYLGKTEPSLLPKIVHILMALYESDVVSEAAVSDWYEAPHEAGSLVDKESARQVRAKATPFIEWLKNAESDDEDDS